MKKVVLSFLFIFSVVLNVNAENLSFNDKGERQRTFTMKTTTPFLVTAKGKKGSENTKRQFIVYARSSETAKMMGKNSKRKLGWTSITIVSARKATKSEVKKYGELGNKRKVSSSADRGSGNYKIKVEVTLKSGTKVIEEVRIDGARRESTAKAKAQMKAKVKHKTGDKYKTVKVISCEKL